MKAFKVYPVIVFFLLFLIGVIVEAHAERFFQQNNSWYEKIPVNAQTKSDSAQALQALRRAPYISILNDAQQWPGEYNVPVFYARPDTPITTVQTGSPAPAILGWNKVPIPPEAVPAGNEDMLNGQYRDGHMVIVSADKKYAWDFFAALKERNGAISAYQIRKWDLRGDGVDQPYWCQNFNGTQTCLYCRVSAVPLLHGLVTYDEVVNAINTDGRINHAIGFGMGQIGADSSYPVEIKYANTEKCKDNPDRLCGGYSGGWYGYRYQLDPNFNCDTFSPLKGNQIICKALQEYGMIYVENTGAGVSLYLEDLDNQPNKKWNGLVSNFVGGIPTDRFIRAVEPVYPANYQPLPECSDGEDNDGDGFTDYPNDPQCSSPQDNDEYNSGSNTVISVNLSPNGVINTPSSNMTINVGDKVTFTGSGADPDNNLPLTFKWRFGAGSGIADSSIKDPGAVQFNIPGTYTVTFTVTDNLGAFSNQQARVITVGNPSSGGAISKSNWRLIYVDSQESVGEDGLAANAFDNNPATFWHTKWYGENAPLPHEIQIDLGGTYDIEGFRYLPRQDGEANGNIGQYEFYISKDGNNWGSLISTGTFANTSAEKEVRFTKTTGKYIRLRALTEVNGNPWTSIAELSVIGGLSSTTVTSTSVNLPPNGVINSPSSNITVNAGSTVNFTGSGTDPDNNLPLTFKWRFGIGSGIADSTAKDPGAVQFNVPGTYTASFTVTDSRGLSDSTPATRVITVVKPTTTSGLIPKTSWRLIYVDSQETVGENGAAVNAFDNNPATIWHTKWYNGSASLPHEIRIDLGGIYSVDGFRYLPRQDGGVNGRIGKYKFYVSKDGVNWGTPVSTGVFANTVSEKEIRFKKTTGRYIRLKALTEVNGKPWTSVAELSVLGIPY
ncbi:MAG: discoidin domain-containing protein [Nitrospirae bacterium]|nr:discoidin domain-containing protein [Nitrospirota bacterium]